MEPGAKLQQALRLALEGGTPVRREPFAPWPHFAPDEIEAVAAQRARDHEPRLRG